jgi:hypothetical protein
MAQPTLARPMADPPGRVEATAVVVPSRAGRRPDRVPRLAALLVWAAGAVNLVSALLPAERVRLPLLDELVPVGVSQGATIATAAAGVGLLLLAGGLRRRQRVAWAATVALLAGSAVLHVVKGLDVEEALGEAFLAGLLAGQGSRFVARPGPREPRRLLGPALAVVGLTLGYGALGLLVNRGDVAEDLSVAGLLGEVARMAVGLGTGLTVIGRFGRFFPASVTAVFWVGLLLVGTRAMAPVLVRRAADSGGACVLPAGQHGRTGGRRPARTEGAVAGSGGRVPGRGGRPGPYRRDPGLRAGGGQRLRRRRVDRRLPGRRGRAGPGSVHPGGPRDADRPAELEPGPAGRVQLGGVPLG